MENKTWNKLSEAEQERIVRKNEPRSKEIYDEDGKECNPVPERGHCIVYFHGTHTHGWLEIQKDEEMGLEALIAKSWIPFEDVEM